MGILDALLTSDPFAGTIYGLQPTNRRIWRRVYFAFDFDDVMRVNNVRKAWAVAQPSSGLLPSFQDSSLWESRKLEGVEALKRLIREGVKSTSVVCVLAGTHTYQSRWVRYEIARSVIDGRGLLAVHINRLNHHLRRTPDALGLNPLHFLAFVRLRRTCFTYGRNAL